MKLLLSLLLMAVPVMAGPDKPKARPASGSDKSTTAAAAPAAAAPAPASAPAAQVGDLDPIVRGRIEDFFKCLQDHRVKDGYTRLYHGSALAEEQPVLMEANTKNTLLLMEKWGRVESGSIIRVRSAGRTLKEVTCILNLQKRPVRLTLYVYFGGGRWQVLDNNADLELHSFFEPEKPAAN